MRLDGESKAPPGVPAGSGGLGAESRDGPEPRTSGGRGGSICFNCEKEGHLVSTFERSVN